MSASNDGTHRRQLRVDRDRHPLLYQWMEVNPYYWSDVVRDFMEEALASGEVPLDLQAERSPRRRKRPRGATAPARAASSRPPRPSSPAPVVQGPEQATPQAQPPDTARAETPPAATPSVEKPNKGVQNNNYATEPAQENAAPVEPEPTQPTSEVERLRKMAAQTLLSNDF